MSIGGLLIKEKAREAKISAVITRADGSIEDVGVVAYWHKNPLWRLWWAVCNRKKAGN
jgi:hypothetical protein